METIRFDKINDEEIAFIRSWYETDQEFSTEIRTIMEKNPFYFSNSITFCRNKQKSMRSLVLFSMCSSIHCKNFFTRIFTAAVPTIADLVLFIETCKSLRGYGTVIHRAVDKWFNSHRTFDLDKELMNNFADKNSLWKNRDILNTFHVKPKNRYISAILRKFCTMDKVRKA